eukprot:CAMPEP_0170547864 /NCGR_PEP_ID=MMETSP0211-20121228/6173_1 /TAXON_ID=311385 /ORGANISM="Pseudokeronopsis sp., Strain OXSARD2" /LENGTH=53 /DNA_ID=CAMNT_0010853067 /DNA_START=67 /DNA_END=228 /DNA_ORIENTATION=+
MTLEEKEAREKGNIEELGMLIDVRNEEEKGITLADGFQKGCGLKGNRLSGGQK